MENNYDKEKIKRFGEITLLNSECFKGDESIQICSNNDYLDNTTITYAEIESLHDLLCLKTDILLETKNNKYIYKDGYIEIYGGFAWLKFIKEDFIELCNYVYDLMYGEYDG